MLQAIVDAEGPIVDDRAHPALVEVRQQRILLARLIVAIRVPMGEQDAQDAAPSRTQYRGTRGVYGIRALVVDAAKGVAVAAVLTSPGR